MNRACLVAISALIAVACDGDKPVPIPTTPNPTNQVLTTFVVQGPPPTVGPGQTAQVKAIARFANGSERDVTVEASWTSTQPQIAMVTAGVITGQALGRTTIRANFMSRNASLAIVVKPEGTFILNGTITEPGPINVGMATVSLLGGPSNQVTANNSGFYELFGVSGTLTLRVSKAGYRDETRILTMTQDQRLDLEIRPILAPTAVAGIYGMTLSISPSCSIVPDDQKTRTYTATIGQVGARVTVQLADARFVPEQNRFNGKVTGSTVTFEWGDRYSAYYYGLTSVQEILAGGQILGIWGTMVAPAAQTISGNLAGGLTFQEGNRRTGCSATDNRVVFTRR